MRYFISSPSRAQFHALSNETSKQMGENGQRIALQGHCPAIYTSAGTPTIQFRLLSREGLGGAAQSARGTRRMRSGLRCLRRIPSSPTRGGTRTCRRPWKRGTRRTVGDIRSNCPNLGPAGVIPSHRPSGASKFKFLRHEIDQASYLNLGLHTCDSHFHATGGIRRAVLSARAAEGVSGGLRRCPGSLWPKRSQDALDSLAIRRSTRLP